MELISDAQLAELDRLHGAATPGDWEACTYSNYSGWSVYAPSVGCIAERWYSTGTQDPIPRNDLFIVAAHNAYPALRERLTAAERERDEVIAQFGDAEEDQTLMQVVQEVNSKGEQGWNYALAEQEKRHTVEHQRDTIAAESERLRKWVSELMPFSPKIDQRMKYREVQIDDAEAAEAEEMLATPATDQWLQRVKAEVIANYIDQNGVTCDCCGHRLIDATASAKGEVGHCTAGDSEVDGSACAHGFHVDLQQRIAEAVEPVATAHAMLYDLIGEAQGALESVRENYVCHGENCANPDCSLAEDLVARISAALLQQKEPAAWLARYTARVKAQVLREAAERLGIMSCLCRETVEDMAEATLREASAPATGEQGGE